MDPRRILGEECRHRCKNKAQCKHQCCKHHIAHSEKRKERPIQLTPPESTLRNMLETPRSYPGDHLVVQSREPQNGPAEVIQFLADAITEFDSYNANKWLFSVLGPIMIHSPAGRQRLEESDHAFPLYFVGRCSMTGLFGFPLDRAKGFRYLCRAADLGIAYARYWVGRCFKKGWTDDGRSDFNLFIQNTTEAADLGNVSACYAIGVRHLNGTLNLPYHGRPDHIEAARYFSMACLNGPHDRSRRLLQRMVAPNRRQSLVPYGRTILQLQEDQFMNRLVPLEITAAQQTFILIQGRRRTLFRDLIFIILNYINTPW